MAGLLVGTVVGNTSPQEYRFFLKSFAAKLGDLVYVETDVPKARTTEPEPPKEKVLVWGRIVELARFNPFLPSEAGQELADEGIRLADTVLSLSRDHVEGKVLVLGMTAAGDFRNMRPLNYPVNPGATVILPPPDAVKTILTGDETVSRLRLGTLIGRPNVDVQIKANAVVARHMAILAMTGGGKTVASRRIIRELLTAGYPLLILDPHGDYLGLYTRRELFSGRDVRLFFPSLRVNDENRDLVGFLVSRMTQGGFTDPQREEYGKAAEKVQIAAGEEMGVEAFIDSVIQELDRSGGTGTGARTISVVKRQLRHVAGYIQRMEISNQQLRSRETLREFPFEALPDPYLAPDQLIRPNQASILYLGGYDHLTQSTIVAIVLKGLFEHRASMSGAIPPFLAVVEEAHNFIPSHSEGQGETPSVDVIRKIITEGRKFGTGLLLVSQRPSRLDETALSQCNTFLIFRLVNPRDQAFVEKVMENLSKDDSRLLPGFGPGQGIVSGQAVRFPLLVQVDHDRELETAVIGDENFLEAAKRWGEGKQASTARRSAELIKELDQATGKGRR